MTRRTIQRGRVALLPVAVLGIFLAAVLAAALLAVGSSDTWRELRRIDASADALAAQARALAEAAGDTYEARVLEAVRRSCVAGGVTRLDELDPVHVEAPAQAAPGQVLLDLAVGSDRAGVLAPIERGTFAEDTPDGLLLHRGQVRTAAALAIPKESIGTIEIDLRTASDGHLLLGWSDDAEAPRLRRHKARVEVLGDDAVRTYAIDAAAALERGLAAGALLRRLFVATRSDAPIELRAIRLLSRLHRYAGAPFGRTHEMLGGQRRSVLHTRVPSSLTYEVDVPTTRPVFEAGLALVGNASAIEFEVTVEDAAARGGAMQPRPALRRSAVAGQWTDVALDLGPWAGRRVRLTLTVRGSGNAGGEGDIRDAGNAADVGENGNEGDAVALWSSPLLRPRGDDADTRPFIVVVQDALRADRLSVYGGPVEAPAHERLARRGVVFERAFAQATQTRSSVPSMMTSLLPSANGTWDFSDALSDRYVTLAEILRACGFATASFVQNGNAGVYAGLAQGFDVLWDEEAFGPRAADLFGETLNQWIDAQRGRPYFAYVHALDPHGPFNPVGGPEIARRAAHPSDKVLPWERSIDPPWLEAPTTDVRRALYDAEVADNDAALGGFLDGLAERGDLERAVVAVVADHGEFLGEHGGLWRHHPPGRVEVLRVPFLLSAPAATENRIEEAVGLLDLLPTLMDLAGIDAPPLIVQGQSLAGTLRGGAAQPRAIPAEEMALTRGWRQPGGCGSFATREALWLASCTPDEQFLAAPPAPGPHEPVRLRRFNLLELPYGRESGPGLLVRRLLEPRLRGRLHEVQEAGIDAWQRMTGATATQRAIVTSEPASMERMRALGYVE